MNMGQFLWVWLLAAPFVLALIDLFTTGGGTTYRRT